MTLQGITEDEIVNYLVHTPGFFERNAQVLASIQLTSPHGQRAVSLQERQMEMLRDKIRGLERRIMEMIRNGQENEAIAERLHRWVRAVLLAHEDTTLADVMLDRLRHEFMIPQAAVRIWATPNLALRDGLSELTVTQPISDDARSFASSLNMPYCGLNSGFEASKWLDDSASITSLALIPLHHHGECFGLLVLGSPDPTRYSADMGVDFLLQVGDIASAALTRLVD
ncbi:MAG: DUF484 family protein [Aquabacterium sp.]|uniref:DUF484 family protein n=1 Tax=Aquabacterium sp. TaxID=1872578 RepID=UPI0011F6FE16|nr:DUF484 family protein [Aquabacterium sp.]TAK91100.1 MAG: DUF484 family protein [Aquabacterium sp.]